MLFMACKTLQTTTVENPTCTASLLTEIHQLKFFSKKFTHWHQSYLNGLVTLTINCNEVLLMVQICENNFYCCKNNAKGALNSHSHCLVSLSWLDYCSPPPGYQCTFIQSNLDYLNTAGPGQNVRINEGSDNQGAHYYSWQLDYWLLLHKHYVMWS